MKTTGSPAPAAMCAALLLMVACGCSQGGAIADNAPAATSSAQPAPPTAGASTVSSRAALLSFAARIGVTCEIAKDRKDLDCIGGRPEVGDYAQVDLRPGCSDSSSFGIAKRSLELRDKISPLDTRTIAKLDRGTPVCIQAIGSAGGKPFYYYVTAIQADFVPACSGNHECVAAGMHWAVAKHRPPCRPDRVSDSPGDCASGWIWADDVARL